MTDALYRRHDIEILSLLRIWERVIQEARKFANAGPLEQLESAAGGRAAARERRREAALDHLHGIRSCLEALKLQAEIWHESDELARLTRDPGFEEDPLALPGAVKALEKAIWELERLRGSNAVRFMDSTTPTDWISADWFWIVYSECRVAKRGSVYHKALKDLARVFGRSLWAESYVKALRLTVSKRRRRSSLESDERLSGAVSLYREVQPLCCRFLDEIRRSRRSPADLKRRLATGAPASHMQGVASKLPSRLREILTPAQGKKLMKWFEGGGISKLKPGRMAAQIAHLKFGPKIADIERGARGPHTVKKAPLTGAPKSAPQA